MKDNSADAGEQGCPIADVQKVIHGKRSLIVIYFLSQGTHRFSELHRRIPDVTEANLTKELRLLEEYGLVHREVYPVVPPKVEYSLTEIGEKFVPVLDALETWAGEYSAGK